jgi:ribosomal protein L23
MVKLKDSILPEEIILNKILFIRGKKVMIDKDLADLYNVSTKRLNEQVKRNNKRFPKDFMFQLTQNEKDEVVANCDHLSTLKYSPNLPYLLQSMERLCWPA